MTLNQQNRSRLVNFIADCRTDWQAAGIEAAVMVLDKRYPNLPLKVAVEAIGWAQDARALTPAAMHDEAIQARIRATEDSAPKPPPPNDTLRGVGTEWCKTHLCNTTLRPDGERACCYFDRMESATPTPVRPVAAPFRDAVPAPAGLRERVAASLGRSVVPGVVKKQEAEQG